MESNLSVKKAIIPIAGLGTRFLPLSKVVPKELWPLVDKPVIQYIIEEAKASGITQIIFVIPPLSKKGGKKVIFNYFKKSSKIEKILKEQKKDHILLECQNLEEIAKDITFSYVFQKKPLGDGDAILQAKNKVGGEPVAVLFADDIVDSKTPCISQLINVFKSCQRPIVALYQLPEEKLPFYGIVAVEKIASRFYKMKKIIEKPLIEEAPSNLAIVGKYIITPEVFNYLARAEVGERREVILAETLNKMIKDGKMIYGYEFEGKWLECGNKLGWLESNFYLTLRHPGFGPKLRKYLNEENL
jgi:UTP--glucose-1-phosphate uridylyltransferase